MGKGELQILQQQQSHDEFDQNRDSSGFFCAGCSVVHSRFAKDFSFKCVFVLILTVSILVSGIFWVLPHRVINYGFDAQEAIKFSASAQAYFILEKPVSELVPHIGRLEYDINAEIGVPDTKIAILSMHQSGVPNWTAVVFGALPDPINAQISPVSLSVLRSSLIEVFMKQTNLTLTASIFGQPSAFEILKFQGGVTVIPMRSASIWQIPQILFNFTLNNSISEILENIVELKYQLKFGLRLRPYENVFVQITNQIGSTAAAPVIIQASVMSDFGNLLPQRLKQLAETLQGSPARNLGLDNSVFGKVKSISLSSYLKGTISSIPPSPSPAPGPTDHAHSSISPFPAPPTYPPSSPPVVLDPQPCVNCETSSPAPSAVLHSPQPCPYHGSRVSPSPSPTNSITPPAYAPTPHSRRMGPKSKLSPDASAVPDVAHAPSPGKSKGQTEGLVSSSFAPSPLSSASSPLNKGIWSIGFSALIIFHLLRWSC
ncbi:uncharacterized protein LOC133782102 [Humulus lupulus]|uniref:uncharacterized protein LOC133782102 n=1 Tax=Humulus lupulus TaxID=3486 RepID=UPI002B402F31|nr:uncharacterized protein LOC133782102 [Humulus lupulus]